MRSKGKKVINRKREEMKGRWWTRVENSRREWNFGDEGLCGRGRQREKQRERDTNFQLH